MRQIARIEPVSKKLPLEDAFLAFTQVSERLTASYQLLEQQVTSLSEELANANTDKRRHLAEKELLAEQLSSLLESLPGAVIVVDVAGYIVKANACAREWFTEALISQRWTLVKQQYLFNSYQLENEYSLENGRVIALSKTELNVQEGFVILLTDITKQRELHQQLEHKKKLAALGEFSAGIAHQIRTPLSSALLYASQLNLVGIEPVKQKKYTKRLLERLRHINTQVTDMLSFAHKGHFKKAVYNLQNISMQLANFYKPDIKRLSIESLSIPPNASVEISKTALFGAIDNLINNAFDAIDDDGHVTCLLRIENRCLIITVTDQGIGLSDAEINQVFEPFYTNKPKGTGLGLAVVREVVKAHGGEIICVSNPGLGTTFKMRLPVLARVEETINIEEYS